MASASTYSHDQSATLRQLKLLVIVLVVSNIGLGALSVYLLRRVDAIYTELFDQSVPVLSDLQELTARSVRAMRLTNPAQANGGKFDASTLEAARTEITGERERRTKLLSADWVGAANAERTELDAAGKVFTEAAQRVIAALTAGQTAEAAELRDSSLRPAFDRYLVAITKASDVLGRESLRASDDATARTNSMSTVVLGVASWPVVVLIALLVLTAIFVLVLMVLFRGREMSDMP